MTHHMEADQPPIAWSAALHTLSRRFGNRTAVRTLDGALSYRALCAYAHGLAQALLDRGAGAQTRIATCLPNGLEAVWAAYGVRLIGAAEVPLGWGHTIDEIAWCARVAGFEQVLTTEERAASLAEAGLQPVIASSITAWSDAPVLPAVPGDAPGRLMFTSGTTGRPRAAVYTHDRRWAAEQLLKASLPFRPAAGEQLLLMTPFSHGASLLTFAWCDDGGEVVLLDGVDAPLILKRLHEEPISAMFAPPTVLAKLLVETEAGNAPAAPSLRCILTGTQPLGAPLYQKVRDRFGPIVRITYGKAECFNPVTVLPPGAVEACLGPAATDACPQPSAASCVGWAAPGVEIEIRAAEEALDDLRSGEVWVRARHMSNGMLGPDGYSPHGPDGWHRSGDLGYLDTEGRLVLTGRVADVIKTGGYRVNPQEIEVALAGASPAGALCVSSIPSEYWGEIIIAIAENPPEGWEGRAAEQVARLSRHKRPRAYLAMDQLPRNAQGKIQRRIASSMVLASHQLLDGPYPELIRRDAAPEAAQPD